MKTQPLNKVLLLNHPRTLSVSRSLSVWLYVSHLQVLACLQIHIWSLHLLLFTFLGPSGTLATNFVAHEDFAMDTPSPSIRLLQQESSQNEIQHYAESRKKTKRSSKVLDEDNYLSNIEKIVERDFFPDLPKLKAQLAYQKALEENDVLEMARLRQQFNPRMSTFRPESSRTDNLSTPLLDCNSDYEINSQVAPKDPDSVPKMSLDRFLKKFTSEDNHSFEEIQEEAHGRERSRVPWLYEDESTLKIKYEKSLELPSIQEQAVKERDTQNIVTWPYTNKNNVMFNPEGLPVEQQQVPKSLEVVHKNTRFVAKAFENENKKKYMESDSTLNAITFGTDGKVANKYEMVQMTPSPSTLNATPLMTWGEIDGTPFRIDTHDTAVPPGTPHFKIPDVPERDRIGMSLADNVSKMYRDRKKRALKHVTSRIKSPLDKAFSSSRNAVDQLNQLSPAARRLATVQLGFHKVRDAKLQASYSPSTPSTPFTPTPGSSRNSTPRFPASPATPSTPVADKTDQK